LLILTTLVTVEGWKGLEDGILIEIRIKVIVEQMNTFHGIVKCSTNQFLPLVGNIHGHIGLYKETTWLYKYHRVA